MLLIPWNRFFLDKLIVVHLFKKSPAFHEIPVQYPSPKTAQLDSMLKHLH